MKNINQRIEAARQLFEDKQFEQALAEFDALSEEKN